MFKSKPAPGPIGPRSLLTYEQVKSHFGLEAFTLNRWLQLRRIKSVRVRLAAGEVGSSLRFIAGDIASAIEYSTSEPGISTHDPMMG
jgi:hypothetical protein